MTKILIIEDNGDIRDNIAELLALHNFTVLEAKIGQEGYDLARKSVPNLIICDLMMPHTEGEVFLNLAKSDLTVKNIPLILFSAGSLPPHIKKRLKAGRDGNLHKPFTEENLLAAITKALAQDTSSPLVARSPNTH